jgi:hypothetical protein
MIGLDARDAVAQTRKHPCAAHVSSHDHNPSVTINSRRSELFTICSIISPPGDRESTGFSHTIFAHDKTREYERFADDLKIAATQLTRDKAA